MELFQEEILEQPNEIVEISVQPSNLSRLKDSTLCEDWVKLQTDFSSTITQAVAFSNFKVFLYYKNGVTQVWQIDKRKKEVEGNLSPCLSHLQYYDSQTVLCLNEEKCQLQLIDITTLKIINKHSPKVPSEVIWLLSDKKPGKIHDLITSGLTIKVLPETKSIVVFEQKNIVCNVNEYILSVFDFAQPQNMHQVTLADEKQKGLFISPLNSSDSILIYQSSFTDEQLELTIFNTLANENPFKILRYEEKFICDAIAATSLNKTEVGLWVNQNSPTLIICDWVNQVNLRVIDLATDPQYCRDKFILKEIYYYNEAIQSAVMSILTRNGEILSLINLNGNKICYQKSIPNDQGMTNKIFSPDGKYFMQLETIPMMPDSQSEHQIVDFSVFYFLNVRTAILNQLKLKGIEKKYGEYASHQIIDMITDGNEQLKIQD